MVSAASNLAEMAQLIELAVAPIFLLTGVATTLVVLIARLARIVDRGRALENKAAEGGAHRHEELALLERRAHLIYRALSLGVSAAIMVCLLMTLAFASEVFNFNAVKAVAVLFMAALFVYTGALMCLLREVFLAINSFSLGISSAAAAPERKPAA